MSAASEPEQPKPKTESETGRAQPKAEAEAGGAQVKVESEPARAPVKAESPPARAQVMPAVKIRAAREPVAAGMRATRDLNDVVHKVLIVGLVLSAGLMVLGLLVGLATGRALTSEVLRPSEAVARTLQLRPSGFISLGIIVLVLTPLLRVVGSVAVFIWERDWRYAGITVVVMMVMLISLLIGGG